MLNREIDCEIRPFLLSDHSLIKISIDVQLVHRTGKGFWKLNTSLLNDGKYVDIIKDIISETGQKYEHLRDKGLIWELINLNIRTTIPYSVQRKKIRNDEFRKLPVLMNYITRYKTTVVKKKNKNTLV